MRRLECVTESSLPALQSPGTFGVNTIVPPAQRPAVGGAEYLAAYVQRLKAQNPLIAAP